VSPNGWSRSRSRHLGICVAHSRSCPTAKPLWSIHVLLLRSMFWIPRALLPLAADDPSRKWTLYSVMWSFFCNVSLLFRPSAFEKRWCASQWWPSLTRYISIFHCDSIQYRLVSDTLWTSWILKLYLVGILFVTWRQIKLELTVWRCACSLGFTFRLPGWRIHYIVDLRGWLFYHVSYNLWVITVYSWMVALHLIHYWKRLFGFIWMIGLRSTLQDQGKYIIRSFG
jgi:hypothetical protein